MTCKHQINLCFAYCITAFFISCKVTNSIGTCPKTGSELFYLSYHATWPYFVLSDVMLQVFLQSLVVTQSPDVCFQGGETGNVSCCWDGTAERVGVKWLKSQTLIENKAVINQSNAGSKNEQNNKCSNLTIENMTKTHSGKTHLPGYCGDTSFKWLWRTRNDRHSYSRREHHWPSRM